MMFNQRSLKDFQKDYKAKKHPEQVQPRNKQIHAPTNKPKTETLRKDTRLPDKSSFKLDYDAKAVKWTGTLTVGDRVFTETASAVFYLMHKLDKLYRKYLKEQSENADDKSVSV